MMLFCGFVGNKNAGLVWRRWLKGATETFPISLLPRKVETTPCYSTWEGVEGIWFQNFSAVLLLNESQKSHVHVSFKTHFLVTSKVSAWVLFSHLVSSMCHRTILDSSHLSLHPSLSSFGPGHWLFGLLQPVFEPLTLISKINSCLEKTRTKINLALCLSLSLFGSELCFSTKGDSPTPQNFREGFLLFLLLQGDKPQELRAFLCSASTFIFFLIQCPVNHQTEDISCWYSKVSKTQRKETPNCKVPEFLDLLHSSL